MVTGLEVDDVVVRYRTTIPGVGVDVAATSPAVRGQPVPVRPAPR